MTSLFALRSTTSLPFPSTINVEQRTTDHPFGTSASDITLQPRPSALLSSLTPRATRGTIPSITCSYHNYCSCSRCSARQRRRSVNITSTATSLSPWPRTIAYASSPLISSPRASETKDQARYQQKVVWRKSIWQRIRHRWASGSGRRHCCAWCYVPGPWSPRGLADLKREELECHCFEIGPADRMLDCNYESRNTFRSTRLTADNIHTATSGLEQKTLICRSRSVSTAGEACRDEYVSEYVLDLIMLGWSRASWTTQST